MSDYYDQLSAAGIPGGPPVLPPQSISNVLSPGIVNLFVQGLETGLVFSQFSQWISLKRKDSEGIAITVLVLFVTTVGLSARSFVFVRSEFMFSHVTVPATVAWRLQYVLRLHGEFTFVISDKL